MRHRPLLIAAIAAPAVVAAPGLAAAANVDVRAVDGTAANSFEDGWSPRDVGVTAGDTVTWRFEGTQVAHNVAPRNAAWTMPASPPGIGQAPVTWQFTTEGTFEYACQIHSEMWGTVHVSPPGQPPPTPPPPQTGPDPLPNTTGPPAPLETGGRDTRRPRVTRLRARAVRNGARISFRLSEQARVTVRIRRNGRTAETHERSLAAGARRLVVRGGTLAAGRYAVEVRARDVTGNDSRTRRTAVTLGA